MPRLILGAVLLFGLLAPVGRTALGEPWLSTRFAQNCAGCHAPGRFNVKPVDRRCSLSCQGCHVNPNGGGLRSLYGKWNENRWLRSFRIEALKHEKNFAPTAQQHYGDDGPKRKKQKKGNKARKLAKNKAVKPKALKAPKDGFPLVEVDDHPVDESEFLRDGREFTVVDRPTFLANIPHPDPYRDMELFKVDGGGDLRYQYVGYEVQVDGEKVPQDGKVESFFMAADFGVRFRPLYRNLHIVAESRMLGSPVEDTRFEDLLTRVSMRSLYAMVDDLPFNVYIMGGYYKPLFGNYVPDHEALAQRLTSFAITGNNDSNYGLLLNAVSIGTAPNVPFANVHMIQKVVGDPDDRTRGFAANLGLRFVTLGAAIDYSYWRTTDARSDGSTTNVEMHAAHLAATFWRLIASLEAVSVTRDNDAQDFRQGGVYTFDTQLRLWREIYATASYATSNVNSQILPGSVTQTKAGLRGFLIQGVELAASVDNWEETTTDPETEESVMTQVSGVSAQLHVFF